MTPFERDVLPPRRGSTPKDTLIKFGSLLGTFRLKKAAEKPENPVESVFVPNNGSLSRLFEVQETCEVPIGTFSSLSLTTMVGEQHMGPGMDKEAVEAHAVSNLARPLVVTSDASQCRLHGNSDDTQALEPFSTDDLCKVPNILLDNLAASFSTLVEARLRAYLQLLARHGVSLGNSSDVPDEERDEALQAVERKLSCLLEIGAKISIDNVVTAFGVAGKLVFPSKKDGMQKIMTPTRMAVGFDVSIPKLTPSGGFERVAIPVKTGGFITGMFKEGSNLLSSVEVELDTHRLLTVMVHEAARIVSIALAHAKEVTGPLRPIVSPPSEQPTDAPLKNHSVSMPDAASKLSGPGIPIVSPDLRALLAAREGDTKMPPFKLEEQPSPSVAVTTQGDSPHMSPASCANLVDFCMEEVGETFLLPSRPGKRMRLSSRSEVM